MCSLSLDSESKFPLQAGYKWTDPNALPKKPKFFIKGISGLTEEEVAARKAAEEAAWLVGVKAEERTIMPDPDLIPVLL